MRLTPATIAGLARPAGKKELIVWDAERSGLALRVTGGGDTKSWFFQYAFAGARPPVPLGPYPKIDIAMARREAKKLAGEVAGGGHPAAERKARQDAARKQRDDDALTLEALIDGFVRAPTKRGDPKSDRHAHEAARALKLMFPTLLKLPVAGLDRKTVVRAHDALAKQSPIAAARTVAYGKAAFNWAIDRGALDMNPFANIRVASSAKRERALSDDEIKAVWTACEGMGTFGAIVRVLALTGQRREESQA
jgi:hypothetical protein